MKKENCIAKEISKSPHEWVLLHKGYWNVDGMWNQEIFYCKFCLKYVSHTQHK